MQQDPLYQCAFCGKRGDIADRLVARQPGIAICNACVSLCREIVAGPRPRLAPGHGRSVQTTVPHSAGPREYACSFCGKSQRAVERLVAGPHSVYICDECITGER